MAPGHPHLLITERGTSNNDRPLVVKKKRRKDNNEAHFTAFAGDVSNMKVYENVEFYNTETTLSEMDCTVSSNKSLATLAIQASQPK